MFTFPGQPYDLPYPSPTGHRYHWLTRLRDWAERCAARVHYHILIHGLPVLHSEKASSFAFLLQTPPHENALAFG